jgi:hypothetical protein
MYKKGQIWSIDLIAGIIIFLIVIAVYFTFVNNIYNMNDKQFDRVYSEALILSDTLLAEGIPTDWIVNNTQEIGLTNGKQRLDIHKVTNASAIDYSRLKVLLKTEYDYLIFFENKNNDLLNLNGVQYIGKPGITKDNIKSIEKPDALVSIKRFVILNNEIVTMVVYLWD